MKPIALFSILIISFFITSCSSNKKNEEISNDKKELIIISEQQFESDKMAFGELQKVTFSEVVKCNGNIVSKSSGTAKISPVINCLVQKINCTVGQKVSIGETLFKLSGNEFLELQKDFAETASQLKRMKSEYKRVKSLYEQNIGTEKEFISTESEYKSYQANYSALKMKIQFIGLDASKIENAYFYPSFSIKSPINGYISQINVSIGQYADQQTIMAEVIDIKQLQLKLAVYEKDLNKLNLEQKINFKLSDNSNNSYTGKLISIGKNVNNESKTIECYADINDLNSGNFVNNAYIEAEIITKTEIVNAITEESIIKFEDENYILAYIKKEDENYFLESVKIETGRFHNGFVEVLNQLNYSKLLSKGVYNIMID